MSGDRKLVEVLLKLALKQEIFITAVNAIMGWIVYNILIYVYGFTWFHAVVFGLIGYVAQVLMFRWLIWFMRSVETEVVSKLEGQKRLTEYFKEEEQSKKEGKDK